MKSSFSWMDVMMMNPILGDCSHFAICNCRTGAITKIAQVTGSASIKVDTGSSLMPWVSAPSLGTTPIICSIFISLGVQSSFLYLFASFCFICWSSSKIVEESYLKLVKGEQNDQFNSFITPLFTLFFLDSPLKTSFCVEITWRFKI